MQIWLRDANLVRRGRLTPLPGSAAVLRDTDTGTFELTLDPDDVVARRIDTGFGIIAVDTGFRFSGPFDHDSITTGPTGELVVGGFTDLVHAADRIIYPDPTKPANQQTTSATYKAKGPADQLIRDLIRLNAGQSAITTRRARGLTVATGAGTAQAGTTETRFDQLLPEVRAIARAAGLSVDIVQDGTALTVQIRPVADRSRRIRFTDENDGAGPTKLARTAATVTTAIVAGQGVGTARTIRELTGPTTWGGRRIETFKDRRDTDDTAELDKAGNDALAEAAESASSTFDVQEAPGAVFGVDYQLGDVVAVRVGGRSVVQPVRSAAITWTGFGRDIALTVGDHDPQNDRDRAWVRQIKQLRAELQKVKAV